MTSFNGGDDYHNNNRNNDVDYNKTVTMKTTNFTSAKVVAAIILVS